MLVQGVLLAELAEPLEQSELPEDAEEHLEVFQMQTLVLALALALGLAITERYWLRLQPYYRQSHQEQTLPQLLHSCPSGTSSQLLVLVRGVVAVPAVSRSAWLCRVQRPRRAPRASPHRSVHVVQARLHVSHLSVRSQPKSSSDAIHSQDS